MEPSMKSSCFHWITAGTAALAAFGAALSLALQPLLT
jgi:hypothetical protein